MSDSVEMTVTIVPVTCGECGCVFGLEAGYLKARQRDHKGFHCPNGHSRYYAGETEADKLRKQLKRTEQSLEWARNRAEGEKRRADATDRKLSATKGVVTKLKKRASAGVCPCCHRHFEALERHMASKHPDFATGDGS